MNRTTTERPTRTIPAARPGIGQPLPWQQFRGDDPLSQGLDQTRGDTWRLLNAFE
jgi:hypothetical protein